MVESSHPSFFSYNSQASRNAKISQDSMCRNTKYHRTQYSVMKENIPLIYLLKGSRAVSRKHGSIPENSMKRLD
ncbi:6699_t:CDS:2 [Acaulospora morrowiae]|uniref:6699_t:CDS:1 n=1 Tax=Acaulospora morrowiae TaxID=94023 RepID=A0A9N9IWF6_9GLOM|nr:6699_t:CDS:2 [Acaulospora morrowiae]